MFGADNSLANMLCYAPKTISAGKSEFTDMANHLLKKGWQGTKHSDKGLLFRKTVGTNTHAIRVNPSTKFSHTVNGTLNVADKGFQKLKKAVKAIQ